MDKRANRRTKGPTKGQKGQLKVAIKPLYVATLLQSDSVYCNYIVKTYRDKWPDKKAKGQKGQLKDKRAN